MGPLGAGSSEAPAQALAEACERAGAAAVVIHGRTKEQRYTRAANWYRFTGPPLTLPQ